jgi:hypothetical protein
MKLDTEMQYIPSYYSRILTSKIIGRSLNRYGLKLADKNLKTQIHRRGSFDNRAIDVIM